jgi:hypothetical protein
MREAGFAHSAQGLDASADAHGDGPGQFLRGLRSEGGEDLRDGVRKLKTAAVRAETESFDFTNPIKALRE